MNIEHHRKRLDILKIRKRRIEKDLAEYKLNKDKGLINFLEE